MTTNWQPLKTELAIWRSDGLQLPLWWRDDDAIAPSSQLDRLATLASSTGVPVHLAIIPDATTQALADLLNDGPVFLPVVHGFAHKNHAPGGMKKSEFDASRPREKLRADICTGLARMRTLFGARLTPTFVPPWNRFASEHLSELTRAGYRAISTFNPRSNRFATGALEQINTHIDPIDWHGSRSLHAPEFLIDHTVALLKNRRLGKQDNSEPLGLVAHHRVHDPAIWDFAAGFIETLLTGPAHVWTAAELKWGTPE